jgi:hypothetical protein
MRRLELFEIHDHPRFPGALRDLVTEALEALWKFGNSYDVILPRLYAGIYARNEEARVLDLCSGGGGPWLGLAKRLKREHGCAVRVCLTDRYPNLGAFEKAASAGCEVIAYSSAPVDAMHVPPGMRGFRTIFSSFHHFGPEDARAVLRDAAASGAGIGVFEVPRRGWRTLLALCFTPLLVLWLTPRIRPFRWQRLFWTYVVPVVPFVIGFDGWASCFRAYSVEELREMAAEIAGYRWEVGVERGGMLPVTYLVGTKE